MNFQSEQEYRSKKEEVIAKFRKEFIEGYYLYDAQTHAIVEMLVRGVDPYQIIEELIAQRKEMDKRLLEHFNGVSYMGVVPFPDFLTQKAKKETVPKTDNSYY